MEAILIISALDHTGDPSGAMILTIYAHQESTQFPSISENLQGSPTRNTEAIAKTHVSPSTS